MDLPHKEQLLINISTKILRASHFFRKGQDCYDEHKETHEKLFFFFWPVFQFHVNDYSNRAVVQTHGVTGMLIR